MDIMEWSEVEGEILNCARYWTTKDRNPTPAQIGRILKLAGRGEVVVCRLNRNSMIFRDGKFAESGPPFWNPADLPPFIGGYYVPYIALAKNMGTFSTQDLANLLYGEEMVLGEHVRSKDKYAKTLEQFNELWPDITPGSPEKHATVKKVRANLRSLRDEGAFICPKRNHWQLVSQ